LIFFSDGVHFIESGTTSGYGLARVPFCLRARWCVFTTVGFGFFGFRRLLVISLMIRLHIGLSVVSTQLRAHPPLKRAAARQAEINYALKQPRVMRSEQD